MRLHQRKLLLDCELICHVERSCNSNCEDCLNNCYYPPPPPPPPSPTNHHISTYFIIGFSIVAAIFIFLCCYAIYVRFFRSSTRLLLLTTNEQRTQDDDHFVLDEDQHQHGPMVDHPIWYIRTPGLQQSIISAITVSKYKKGEGLIDGTDCSVCLSEFQEDESLRILPKCNHAFHLPCIDTWLRSHTNCPLCRAPIVITVTDHPSSRMEEPNNVFGSSSVETETETETSGGGGMEDAVVAQLRNEEEEQVEENGRRGVCEGESESSGLEEMVNMNMKPRRSVSLDSSSAAKINLALSTVVLSVEESHHERKLSQQIVSKSVVAENGNLVNLHSDSSSSLKRSQSFNGKHLLSWYSRTQKKSNGPVRSF